MKYIRNTLSILLTCGLLLGTGVNALAAPTAQVDQYMGSARLFWMADPMARGYRILHAPSAENPVWSYLATIEDTSLIFEQTTGFYRILPLYENLPAISDTLVLKVNSLQSDPAILQNLKVEWVDSWYGDTIRFSPTDAGEVVIPVRIHPSQLSDQPGLNINLDDLADRGQKPWLDAESGSVHMLTDLDAVGCMGSGEFYTYDQQGRLVEVAVSDCGIDSIVPVTLPKPRAEAADLYTADRFKYRILNGSAADFILDFHSHSGFRTTFVHWNMIPGQEFAATGFHDLLFTVRDEPREIHLTKVSQPLQTVPLPQWPTSERHATDHDRAILIRLTASNQFAFATASEWLTGLYTSEPVIETQLLDHSIHTNTINQIRGPPCRA